jgi:hypothetical protein
MNTEDLHKVWEIKTLKRKPGEEDARKILEKIAKQIQPIMRKHKWRVKVLSEFCPTNPSLLGVNVGGGINVKLRLRRHNRDWDFIPYDQVLDTMLHELCHNDHGPHNASFYKLWDELRKECEELMAKGITGSGEGFDLPGQRLGGFTRQPPLTSLRQTALSAAENRARKGILLGSGPKRVGGDHSIMAALTPVQAAAMAAERRYQDEIWCASASFQEPDEVEELSSTDLIQKSKSQKIMTGAKPIFIDVSDKEEASTSEYASMEESPMWECVTCTLLNPPLAPICEVCNTEKPKNVEDKYKVWGCKFCTLENSVKLDRCSACGEWRYSHGAPIAAPPVNLGT